VDTQLVQGAFNSWPREDFHFPVSPHPNRMVETLYESLKAFHAFARQMYNGGSKQMRCSLYTNLESPVVYTSFGWHQSTDCTTLGMQCC
jgi:hypothetical protein